jgi:CHAD domain-containing protein
VILGSSPQRLLSAHLEQFLLQVPKLRDGDERAIHDARVSIRRLREPLALVRAGYEDDHLLALDGRIGKVFKALGRARDADIAQRLVQHIETRFPLAPGAISHVRATISRDQLNGRRRLVRALESTEAHTFGEAFDSARHHQRWRFLARTPWRDHLRTHIHNRANELVQALERAGGVYFRNRSHSARVSIKQLRYALELGDGLGVAHGLEVQSLRKAQNALGEAHDRDVLVRRISDLADEGTLMPKQEAGLLEQFLAGEIGECHQRFLALRPNIHEVIAAILRPRRRLPVRAGAMAVAALAIGEVIRRNRA